MLDHKFSWQTPGPYDWAEELKGFNPNQPRSKDGRFGTGAGKTPVGQAYLDLMKVGGGHKITVHNSRVRKYAGHADVESFIAGHKRGTALAKPGASLKPIARDPKRSDLDTLRAAHAQVADSGDAARLSHVRTVLGNYSRPEQDRMFQGALHSKDLSLSQLSDNKAIDGIEKAAAFTPAGEPNHLLRATHKGRKSADDFDADDFDAIDAVTPADVADLFDDDLLASAGYA